VGCRVLIHAKPATCQSWDYRAKQGFYVGPALDHYRCYKLVKSEMKRKVISDMVDFRHAYLQIPEVSADTKIINGLQVMDGALQNTPPPTSYHQVDAIEMLSTLLEKWKCLAPPVLQTDSRPVCIPRVSPTPMLSRVQDTTPAPNLTNNPLHALANDNDEDEPSATTWAPPLLPASVPRTPAPPACIAPLLYRPLPRDLSLTTLHLQVDPLQSHNQAHCHFQGCQQHQALLLIVRGHILHHRTTVPWWHWYNTISQLPKQHNLHTP
jgi:hypothetical protein